MQSGLILLVDADRRVQKAFTRAATEQGLEVVACDTARAGVNAACALEPTAIVTELELPDFDGHWLLSQIRDQPTEVAVTPIIVVTHEIDTSSRGRTLDAGADVFLQKPIAAADLLAQVRALVTMTHRILERRRTSILLPLRAPSAAPEAPAPAPPMPVALVIPGGPTVPITRAAEPRPPNTVPPEVAAALDPVAVLDALEGPAPAAPKAVERAPVARTADPDDEWPFDSDDLATNPRLVLSALDLAGTAEGKEKEAAARPPSGRASQRPPSRPSQRPPSRTSQRPPPAKAGPTRPPSRPSKPPKTAAQRPPPVKVPFARVPALDPPADKAVADKAAPDKPPLAKPAVAAVVPKAPARLGGPAVAVPKIPAAPGTPSALRPVVGPTVARPAPAPAAAASLPKPAAAPAATDPKRSKGGPTAPRTPAPGPDDDEVIEAENDG